jgi:hypothetical protein
MHPNQEAILDFARKCGLKDAELVYIGLGLQYELRGRGTSGKPPFAKQLAWVVAEKCGIYLGCGSHSTAQVCPDICPDKFQLPQ